MTSKITIPFLNKFRNDSHSKLENSSTAAGTKTPVRNSIMPSRELSVFWRIENFSLLGYFISARSAPFGLRCGEEERNTLTFQIVFHPSRALFLPGTVQLRAEGSLSSKKRLPPLRVSFSVVLATGEHQKFHDKGEILDGKDVIDCKGRFKRFPFLLRNRARYLPDDSLTFLTQFACEKPIFGMERLFARTRIPISDYAYNLKFDLSTSVFWRIHPQGLPIEVALTNVTNYEDAYEIVASRKGFGTRPVICDLYLEKSAGERVLIKKFAVVALTYESFVLSKQFCDQHVKQALRNRGTLKLYLVCHIDDGDPVLYGFSETPFESDRGKNKPLCPSKPPRETKQKAEASKGPQARNGGNGTDKLENSEDSDSSCSLNGPKTETVTGDERLKVDLMTDLQNLYSQRIFCDFTLRVGDKSFPVHKNILSARSVVFRAMFEADALENCSEVTDVDADTMDRMLRFVYFNEFNGDQDVDGTSELFAAADKYKIESLKSSCVESLAAGLSVENVCSVLSLADTHGDQTLMARAKEFLSGVEYKVYESENWRRFMAERSQLASGIMLETIIRSGKKNIVHSKPVKPGSQVIKTGDN